YLPPVMSDEHAFVFHSSDYLKKRDDLDPLERITVVGSGQSAAEIFDDLLSSFSAAGKHLHWLTRADRIYPMDYSRFALEMTSPDYIDYFYKLPENKKNGLLREQSYLYKGVNAGLIDQIYHKLYVDDLSRVVFGKRDIRLSCELEKVDTFNDEIRCFFKHRQTLTSFTHSTDALIMATGYKYDIPEFLLTIKDRINWENDGRYKISRNYSIDNEQCLFVQNAELYSHGFNAPDLGMGPYRNAIILNTILNSNYFDIEDKIAFQNFD
ncbi:MAG TPA: SidA/IucD/PvdA family monooxygenase, partial [Arachidicoccus sp.]|nr:SidA/IucD/PvdA family monooxygenase [Arachidicoccus sp.]